MLFIVPRRDQLFLTDATDPDAAGNMATMIRATLRDNHLNMSADVYRRTGGVIARHAG